MEPMATMATYATDVLIDCKIKELHYGKFQGRARRHVKVKKGTITAFIGPSGCGKSTALRCLNRMNDLVRGFRFKGHVLFRGQDIYAPNDRSGGGAAPYRNGVPAAQSVCDEHLSATSRSACASTATRAITSEKVEQALRQAALWDEVKDKLQGQRPVAVGWTAAAPVHRARDRHRARGAADGRALLGAGSRSRRAGSKS